MERSKVTIYTAGLAAAFALHLAVFGAGRGAGFWAPALIGLAGLALGLPFGRPARRAALFRAAVLLVAAVALAVPLGEAMVTTGATLGQAVAAGPVWPPILVAFFASRVLAAETDLRFVDFWSDPLGDPGAVQIQSSAAALLLGIALALAFHLALPWLKSAAPAGATGILVAALAGETILHTAIILLFFVVLAHLADALRLYWRDRQALAALRRLGRAAKTAGRAEFRRAVAAELDAEPESRLLRRVAEWLDLQGAGGQADAVSAAAAQEGFHRAARQFARGLVPFLPLIGFLGTVVGLATAMAELPHGLGDGRGGADVAASLAGLAIKFETTLLGLVGSIVASLLIALLERRETELVAEAGRIVDAVLSHGGRGDG